MAEKFDVVDVIKVKRDGGELSPEEIAWMSRLSTAASSNKST